MSRVEGGKNFSRRKFFTEFFERAAESVEAVEEKPRSARRPGLGKYVAVGAGASLVAAEAASQMGKGEFPNLRPVETKNAYYRIFYGHHGSQANPKEVEEADALLLEGPFDFLNVEASVQDFIRERETPSSLPHFVAILAEARRRHIPVFMIDVGGDSTRSGLDVAIQVLEFMFGIGLTANALFPKNDQLSRRAFLNRGGGVLGVYLLTPTLADLTATISGMVGKEGPVEGSISRSVGRGLYKFNQAAHPEANRVRLHLRDAFMAQKSESVARYLQGQLRKKPKLNIHLGAAHVGIEEALHESEKQRLQAIRSGLGEELFQKSNIIIRVDFVDENGNPIVDEQGNESMRVTLIPDPGFQKEE